MVNWTVQNMNKTSQTIIHYKNQFYMRKQKLMKHSVGPFVLVPGRFGTF